MPRRCSRAPGFWSPASRVRQQGGGGAAGLAGARARSEQVAPPGAGRGARPVQAADYLAKGAGVCVRALGHALTEVSIERACSSTHVSGKRSS